MLLHKVIHKYHLVILVCNRGFVTYLLTLVLQISYLQEKSCSRVQVYCSCGGRMVALEDLAGAGTSGATEHFAEVGFWFYGRIYF